MNTVIEKNAAINSVPFQPFISKNKKIAGYQEKLICWHPEILKAEGLAYQFAVREEAVVATIFPDACVNFLFMYDGENSEVWASGLATKPICLYLQPNTIYFGFKPYSNIGMTHKNQEAKHFVDKADQAQEIFNLDDSFIDEMFGRNSFESRCDLLLSDGKKYLVKQKPDTLVPEILSVLLCDNNETVSLTKIEQDLGYSTRYSQQLFKSEIGLSPKKYSRVIRFQNCLKELISQQSLGNLADIAIKLGYYDQAHLIRDFKGFTDFSPVKLLRKVEASRK